MWPPFRKKLHTGLTVCSFGQPCFLSALCLFLILVISHLGFEGKTLVLIATDPVHCVPFYFLSRCRL